MEREKMTLVHLCQGTAGAQGYRRRKLAFLVKLLCTKEVNVCGSCTQHSLPPAAGQQAQMSGER